jgi:hypothetical protein
MVLNVSTHVLVGAYFLNQLICKWYNLFHQKNEVFADSGGFLNHIFRREVAPL